MRRDESQGYAALAPRNESLRIAGSRNADSQCYSIRVTQRIVTDYYVSQRHATDRYRLLRIAMSRNGTATNRSATQRRIAVLFGTDYATDHYVSQRHADQPLHIVAPGNEESEYYWVRDGPLRIVSLPNEESRYYSVRVTQRTATCYSAPECSVTCRGTIE